MNLWTRNGWKGSILFDHAFSVFSPDFVTMGGARLGQSEKNFKNKFSLSKRN